MLIFISAIKKIDGGHRGHGLCCPGFVIGAPSTVSHKLVSFFPMEVPFTKLKWPCPLNVAVQGLAMMMSDVVDIVYFFF